MGTNKNAYLEKRDRFAQIITKWTNQVNRDALLMILEDIGLPLEERIEQLLRFDDYVDEISIGLSRDVKASHVRRQTDDRLEKDCDKYFAPWSDRYIYWDDRGI